MKQGRSLQDLAAEINRQAAAARDFRADTRDLIMQDGGKSITLGDVGTFGLRPLAHQQIATELGIPWKYYEKMQAQNPDLLDDNVNSWFRQTPKPRLVRTLDGDIRAMLSDRYRRMDNLDVAKAIMPVLHEESGTLKVASCEVTETKLYIKLVSERVKAEVRNGDVVQAGVVISNSEVGLGAVHVAPLVFRLVCLNGAVVEQFGQRRNHIGRAEGASEGEVYELYEEETLKADDHAFFLKLRDTVKASITEASFERILEGLRTAASTEIQPKKAIEEISKRFGLNEKEGDSLLGFLINEHDASLWGLSNALTAMSQSLQDYERERRGDVKTHVAGSPQ